MFAQKQRFRPAKDPPQMPVHCGSGGGQRHARPGQKRPCASIVIVEPALQPRIELCKDAGLLSGAGPGLEVQIAGAQPCGAVIGEAQPDAAIRAAQTRAGLQPGLAQPDQLGFGPASGSSNRPTAICA